MLTKSDPKTGKWQEPPNHQRTPPPPGQHSVPYRHIGQAQWCLHFTLCWMSVWGLQKFCQLRKRVIREETPNVEKSKLQITSGGSKLTCMEKLKSMQHKMNIWRIQISFTPFCQGGCVLRHWAVVWTPSLRLWILLPALQVSKVPKVYRDHPTSSTIPERFCNNVTRRHLKAPLCASRKCGGGVGTSNEIYPFSKPVLHEIQQHWNDSHWIDWQHG